MALHPRCCACAAPSAAPAGCCGVQEVQEAPRIMGPDALIKQKIKQTRFRCGAGPGRAGQGRAGQGWAGEVGWG